jgi:Domain of unknown function (DUF1998)
VAENSIRMSQLVGLFGPGAMLDLPDRSVLVLGIDHWEMRGRAAFQKIEEARLQRLLYLRLKDDDRIVGDKPPELRSPPIDKRDPRFPSPAVRATVFPRWFACEAIAGDAPNRRRLVRDLEAPKREIQIGPDGKKRKASPIRFVCGCENGHLQDIEWRRALHQNQRGEEADKAAGAGPCRKPMWLEDSGTSADPRDTRIVCECGASLSLEELFQPGRLGGCPGARPWIASDDFDPNTCDASRGLRLLTRSATNTYFPQIARVISLPQAADAFALNLEAVWTDVSECKTVDDVKQAKRFNSAVRANLQDYADVEILARIQAMSAGGARADEAEDPKIAEFQLLASGRALIGANNPDANLHAETLPRAIWDPDLDPELSKIGAVVAVHRLREVACIYGFTRFEPAPLASDDLEDVGLAVKGAPLGQNPDWLPAIEQFGEGVFIHFSEDALAQWLARPIVLDRSRKLQEAVKKWAVTKRASGMKISVVQVAERARPEYVMAHSLAHALMSEVAIECGYPASALKERIYLLERSAGEPVRCGVLIYTASAGNQGTLGGLVEVTHRFSRVIKSALERARLCSGDPVCADHDPLNAQDDRMLHGAACHGCLLISETSCEARNVSLDRALLVDTIALAGAAFF